MPHIAKNLDEYLSDPSTLLPEPVGLEKFARAIGSRHKKGGSTSSRYFGDAVGQALYAVSVYPDRSALIPGPEIPAALLYPFIRANHYDTAQSGRSNFAGNSLQSDSIL